MAENKLKLMEGTGILLIEDDELDVISVQRTLEKLDVPYTLFTAYNGIEALNMLRDQDQPVIPDIILLDLNMPRMNGIEFLTVLRADSRFDKIKVFIMTTSSEHIDRATTQELGVSGYFIKPLGYTDNSKRTDSMDAFVQFHLRKIMIE
jgi:CheY-like chemotaxis protein